jgi:nitrite reductase/ring-hydroxylating ferredoxin subunit
VEPTTPAPGLVFAADTLVARKLERLAAQVGVRWEHRPLGGLAEVPAGQAAAVVVVDADRPDGLDLVREGRARWPGAVVAAFLATPDPDTWVAAQRAGADVVANRGALAARLREHLDNASSGRIPLFPVLPEADVGGRLGLVARLDEGPDGPLAVFQVDGRVHVVADRCPHAGARLSDGELDHRVLTCPRHGSQFDVTTGERLRGPADCALLTYKVEIESGHYSVVADRGTS